MTMRTLFFILRMLFDVFRHGFAFKSAMKDMARAEAGSTALEQTLEAYKRGDYERAIQHCEGLKTGGEVTPPYAFFRGSLLMQMGAFKESEQWLLTTLKIEKSPQLLALANSALSQLMTKLGRFEEALHYSAAGLKHAPGKGGLHRDMAEALLRRGDNPANALDLARQAVDEETQPGSSVPGVQNLNQGENLATLAWAVAKASGRREEVECLVVQAVSQVGMQSVSSTAQVHLHSGLAYAELGDRVQTLEHLRTAAAMDPKGVAGRDAKAILESQSCQ